MSSRRLSRLKRLEYFFVFLFAVVLINSLIDKKVKSKLNKTLYKIGDFLDLNIRLSDDSVPAFYIDELRNYSNHLCIIPLLNYQDSTAIRYLNSDLHTLESTFKECEPNNYKDSYKIENFLIITASEKEIYEIKLNTSLIETEFKISKQNLRCTLQRFDKKLNASEELEGVVMISPIYEFDSNFELKVNQTGFYYLECNKLNLISSNLFSHVYIVYPYRMSKLIQQHSLHRKNVEEFISKFNNSKSKLMLNDFYASECETNNFNKKKMNILILGLDSLSLSHFRRVFPLTFEYLNSKSIVSIISIQ